MKKVYVVSVGLVGGSTEPSRAFETLEGAKDYIRKWYEGDLKILSEFVPADRCTGLKIGNSFHIEEFELKQEKTLQ